MSKTTFTSILVLVAALGATATVAARDTLQAINDQNEVRLGYRSSSVPFSVVDEDGKPHGYSIDLCSVIAEEIRDHLGRPDLKVTWVPVSAETRLANVRYGYIHLECGSTTNTISRQQIVDFSYPIYITGTRMLVRKGEDLNWFRDLEGKVIAVLEGATTENTVNKAIASMGLNVRIGYVEDHAAGFKVLAEGKADAYVSDDILLYGLIKASANPDDYEVVGDFLSYEPYGLVMPRDDADFRVLVNATLSRLSRAGILEQDSRQVVRTAGAADARLVTSLVCRQRRTGLGVSRLFSSVDALALTAAYVGRRFR